MQQPNDRQILVGFGNRYAVFGSGANLPDRSRLGPQDVKTVFARVADERNGVIQRILESLKVKGFQVSPASDAEFGDFTITDENGEIALVEVKTGDRDFAGLNLGDAWEELGQAAQNGQRREIWAFNLERLGLGIVWSDGAFAPGFVQLPALNVWEFNQDRSVFERKHLIDHLDDWLRRIESVYAEVESFALKRRLTASKSRTIPMSEELMQQFAVPDRDLPILDISAETKPIASFVPIGLWLIGSNGMIHIITQHETLRLSDQASYPNPPNWVLINPKDRSATPWNENELGNILGLVPADE